MTPPDDLGTCALKHTFKPSCYSFKQEGGGLWSLTWLLPVGRAVELGNDAIHVTDKKPRTRRVETHAVNSYSNTECKYSTDSLKTLNFAHVWGQSC